VKPTITLAESTASDGTHLALIEHDSHFYLHLDGMQLQSTYSHGAADQLAALGCAPFRPVRQPRILVAGLGLGFCLNTARQSLPQKRAVFLVAEPLADLPSWHRSFLADLHPGQLEDPRLVISDRTLLDALIVDTEGFQAILLDAAALPPMPAVTDRKGLPVSSFLHRAHSSLKEGGLLAVSNTGDASTIERRLRQAGFDVAQESVPASHKGKQKRRSTIWLARKGAYQKRSPGKRDAHH
jgi:spermidine synthase